MPWKWTQRARENITARWRKFTRPTPTFPVRLHITQTLTDEMHRIGGSSYGNIYSGRAVTPNGKTIRVAIKVFHSPPSNRRAQAYQRII